MAVATSRAARASRSATSRHVARVAGSRLGSAGVAPIIRPRWGKSRGRSAVASKMALMVQAPQADAPAADFRFVGRRIKRADAPERLTGRLRFTNDLQLPGALHVRFVRSPHAAARVVSIDATEARAIPGVQAVLTACDLPVPDIQAAVDGRRIMLALDAVLYAGQPVAAVLAESEAIAEDAVQAVEV